MGSLAHERPVEHRADISYLGFNQDQTCLAVGTWRGFRIFSTETFALLHQEMCGPVALVEMLFRTSLLALVGSCSPSRPSVTSSRQLTMWNTKERCNICQLHFNTTIHGVKMNHRRVVVLLERKLHIFDLKTMKNLHVIDRTPSPWADPSLGWLCAASEHGYLATPMALAGRSGTGVSTLQANAWSSVHSDIRSGADRDQACDGGSTEASLGLVTVVDTYTLTPVGTVLAHRSPIQALCLNPTGQLLATSSSKGTVVRLFAVPALDMLYSFRRGANSCRIFGLSFSRDSAHVCASAATGTVHIFRNSEKVLASLPLRSEEATVGAAQREMISRACPSASDGSNFTKEDQSSVPVDALLSTTAPLQALPIRLGPQEPATRATETSPATRAAENSPEEDELSDWNIVAERPERLLELYCNTPSYSSTSGTCSKRNALQTLAAASGYAVENTANIANTFKQLLPQNCRELVDAPRAFAWVRLREEDTRDAKLMSSPLSAVLGGGGVGGRPEACQSQQTHCWYAACVSSKPRGHTGRAEVLVASARGCAHMYDWNPLIGGECRLRTEHSFAQWRQPRANVGEAEASATTCTDLQEEVLS